MLLFKTVHKDFIKEKCECYKRNCNTRFEKSFKHHVPIVVHKLWFSAYLPAMFSENTNSDCFEK